MTDIRIDSIFAQALFELVAGEFSIGDCHR
jgi:hypothetical protein